MENLLFIVLPICLATSFLCAGMEGGMFALSRWRIAQQMRAGKKRAARLYSFLQNTENFLWTILVGNTLAAFFALWIVAVALLRTIPGRPFLFWTSFFAAVLLFYGFCDLLPKMLFRTYPNRLCLALSTPFRFLHVLLSPLVALIEGLTGALLRWTGGKVFKGHVFSKRNELRLLMEDTSQSLTIEERGMIRRVFDLNTIFVRQITTPFARYPTLTAENTVADGLKAFRQSAFTTVPVWNAASGKQRRVAGFLADRTLLFNEQLDPAEPLRKRLAPVLYFDEDVPVQEALRRFQKSGYRVAVVLSRANREIGVATLDSILNAIFGEVKL